MTGIISNMISLHPFNLGWFMVSSLILRHIYSSLVSNKKLGLCNVSVVIGLYCVISIIAISSARSGTKHLAFFLAVNTPNNVDVSFSL